MAVCHSNTRTLSAGRKGILLLLALVCLSSFNTDGLLHELAGQTQQRLIRFHGTEPEADKVRKCEITISDEGFVRYRRTYINGKQEFYSMNLSSLKSMDYYGSTQSGRLSLRTMEDDVIVQTYNDRRGNVDSMAFQLELNLKAIEPEDLASLQRDMLEIKRRVSQ